MHGAFIYGLIYAWREECDYTAEPALYHDILIIPGIKVIFIGLVLFWMPLILLEIFKKKKNILLHQVPFRLISSIHENSQLLHCVYKVKSSCSWFKATPERDFQGKWKVEVVCHYLSLQSLLWWPLFQVLTLFSFWVLTKSSYTMLLSLSCCTRTL